MTSAYFTELPKATQLLYNHLNYYADDEGYVGNIKGIMAGIGATSKHLKDLEENGLIITFDFSKVVVITDWWVHNKHEGERDTKHTVFTREKAYIEEDKKTRKYIKIPPNFRRESADKQTNIKENNINKNKQNKSSSVCSSVDSIKSLLTPDEEAQLKTKHKNYEGLIKYCDESIMKRTDQTPIKHAFAYIESVANKVQWDLTQGPSVNTDTGSVIEGSLWDMVSDKQKKVFETIYEEDLSDLIPAVDDYIRQNDIKLKGTAESLFKSIADKLLNTL